MVRPRRGRVAGGVRVRVRIKVGVALGVCVVTG